MEIIVCVQIVLVCVAVNIGVMTYKRIHRRESPFRESSRSLRYRIAVPAGPGV